MSILSEIVEHIYHFIGGRQSLDEVGIRLDRAAHGAVEKLDWRNSSVDLLKLTNQDSSLEARKNMAKSLGYAGKLDGSAEMNQFLHDAILEKLR